MLYIAATPIGNFQDITLRALQVLKSVDVILCEDTRVAKKLLDHYQIEKTLLSYHQHSDRRKVKEIADLIKAGKNLALITDAGTPGISDPGNKLIADLRLSIADLKISPLPGVCAAIAALSVSGFPSNKFYFAGFPPLKNKRLKFFQDISAKKETIVFYESTHRIIKTLEELQKFLSAQRKILIARELTKRFETIYCGKIAEVIEKIKGDSLKGEFVIVISAE